MGQCVCGIALCASDDCSAWYDLDRIRGILSRPKHKVNGENNVEKILVLNTAKRGSFEFGDAGRNGQCK